MNTENLIAATDYLQNRDGRAEEDDYLRFGESLKLVCDFARQNYNNMGERANLVSTAGDAGNNQETGKHHTLHSDGNIGSPATKDECRAAFERWYDKIYPTPKSNSDLERHLDEYKAPGVSCAWRGFQAAWQLRTPTTSPALSELRLAQLQDELEHIIESAEKHDVTGAFIINNKKAARLIMENLRQLGALKAREVE